MDFILYTAEGYTTTPNGNCDMDNCQILDFQDEVQDSKENAIARYLDVFPESQTGFDSSEIVVIRRLPDSVHRALLELVRELSDEKYQKDNVVIKSISILRKYLSIS